MRLDNFAVESIIVNTLWKNIFFPSDIFPFLCKRCHYFFSYKAYVKYIYITVHVSSLNYAL